MDKKMNEALNDIYERLTDEQKEKAKECKTVGDLMDYVSREKIEIPEELLGQVAGGVRVRQGYPWGPNGFSFPDAGTVL